MDAPYLQYREYMIRRHGAPLFRVPIDFGLGCPNRAPDGSGGCAFCNERGARAIQTLETGPVEEQMARAIRFARDRYGAKKYMAYIQAFTATFEPEQQEKYRRLLQAFDFAAVSIGTRPDCIDQTACAFLAELNRDIETWVELGVQTVHDRTLRRINRGHGWAESERAIRQLHELGIKVAAHVILGLPGETAADFRRTAETLAALPIDAIKIHNLHIEKGTALAAEYAEGAADIHPMMEYEYAEHLMDFIRRLPPRVPVMRVTTDTPPERLVAPKWHMQKGQFIDHVVRQMVCREWRQGDLHGNRKLETGNLKPGTEFRVVATEDGSTTFWNDDYREHYHTPAGARLEAEGKYLRPARLGRLLARGPVRLLDVCFGLGYNSLCALNRAVGANAPLAIDALEMDRRVVRAAAESIQPLETDPFDWKKTLAELYATQASRVAERASINILWGDARHTATLLPEGAFDLVFLDAFSTQRNPELWTVDFFRTLRGLLKPDGALLTYCAALPVRSGLMEAGFFVGETKPVGRARGGTIATLRPDKIEIPLPAEELETIRETTRGLPYRDPHGVWTGKEILRDRQERILEAKKAMPRFQ